MDILFALLHHVEILLLRHIRLDIPKLYISGNRSAIQSFTRPFIEQQISHLIQRPLRLLIGAADILVAISFLNMHVSDKQNALLYMIEYNNPIAEHKLNILQVHIVNLMSRKLLIILKQIVAKKSDRPARKRRHFRKLRTPVFSQNSFKLLQGLARQFNLLSCSLDDNLALLGLHHHERICTDEGISGPLNPPLYAFQQKCFIPLSNPAKYADWCLHVS
ncbi:hypothetical protein D3C77_486650 [compost metagenome]